MPKDVRKMREAGPDELRAEVRQLREQLFKLRWQAAGGQIDNPKKIREVRRDIARHLTVLSERSRSAARREEPEA
jgi:large subunit ribosomal protein L29